MGQIHCHVAFPSSEGCGPPYTTSKNFGRVYDLRRNAKRAPHGVETREVREPFLSPTFPD